MRVSALTIGVAIALVTAAAAKLCGGEAADQPAVISGGGCRFPDVAYNSQGGGYLVVWVDYNRAARGVFGRRLDDDGHALGEAFRISAAAEAEALFPSVAYNAVDNEYLVTFDTSRSIGGQRIRASDGSAVGDNFVIGAAAGAIRSAVAWSGQSTNYLVVYYAAKGGRPDVYARRVSGAGEVLGDELNVSQDANYSGYPAVAYAAQGDQFLVAWDHEPSDNVGHIRGRRISAATGRTIGDAIDIATGGTENRAAIAYDSTRQRWLVQFNEASMPGYSYNQGGRFVDSDGRLLHSVDIARTKAFEGETLFGGDVCFSPGGGGRFFSSYPCESQSTAMAGRELLADGERIGPQINLGTGPYTCLNNAADTRRNRFLTVWEGLEGRVHFIHARLVESQSGNARDP